MKFVFNWIIIFLACVIFRLPYLLGPHVYFDGDEAIVGIMAQDLLAGDSIPVYFYGQQYGFAFFEVLSTAFFLMFLGNGVFALKLGGLLIFSLGLAFIRRLLSDKKAQPWLAWCIIILLSVFPVWFLWAAKVRGGYVTAFAAVCILTYILNKEKISWKEILLSALFVSIAAVSHVMMVLPFGFFVVYLLWRKLKWQQLAGFILAVMGFYFLLKIPAYTNVATWTIAPRMELNMAAIGHMFSTFPGIFMGYFYYDYLFPVPLIISVVFALHISVFVTLFIIRAIKGFREEKIFLSLGFLGFMVSCLIALYIDGKGYRYFIGPLTVFLAMYAMLVYAWLSQGNFKVIKVSLFLVLFIAPSLVYREMPAFWSAHETNDMRAFKELNHRLHEQQVAGIFCTDALMAWQLNYYGANKYSARYLFRKDRLQRFIDKTDDCHSNTDCKTAIVGIYGGPLGMDSLAGWHESVIYVGERFYIQPDVKKEFLMKAGFELRE